MMIHCWLVSLFKLLLALTINSITTEFANGFVVGIAYIPITHRGLGRGGGGGGDGVTTAAATTTRLEEMKRPLLDQLASTLFDLENARVKASSQVDEKGREGEPMEWSEKNSLANQFSEFMATFGYGFKQFVADIVAGDFDEEAIQEEVDQFVADNTVAMFSFTTCPFCRRAKDYLEENGIEYAAMELDALPDNRGNEIRAVLGRKTRRTSVPSIFVRGKYIGGCNDGPGLLPLAESGELDKLL